MVLYLIQLDCLVEVIFTLVALYRPFRTHPNPQLPPFAHLGPNWPTSLPLQSNFCGVHVRIAVVGGPVLDAHGMDHAIPLKPVGYGCVCTNM